MYLAESSEVYYGDSGAFIKSLDWKKGNVDRIPNHSQNIGFTDSVTKLGELLVSSYYDIDTGCGGLNLWSVESRDERPVYIATIQDEDTSRILSIAAAKTEADSTLIATGGRELKLWRQMTSATVSDNDDVIVRCHNMTMFSLATGDSGSGMSESELSEDEMISSIHESSRTLVPDKKSGFCNCNLM